MPKDQPNGTVPVERQTTDLPDFDRSIDRQDPQRQHHALRMERHMVAAELHALSAQRRGVRPSSRRQGSEPMDAAERAAALDQFDAPINDRKRQLKALVPVSKSTGTLTVVRCGRGLLQVQLNTRGAASRLQLAVAGNLVCWS